MAKASPPAGGQRPALSPSARGITARGEVRSVFGIHDPRIWASSTLGVIGRDSAVATASSSCAAVPSQSSASNSGTGRQNRARTQCRSAFTGRGRRPAAVRVHARYASAAQAAGFHLPSFRASVRSGDVGMKLATGSGFASLQQAFAFAEARAKHGRRHASPSGRPGHCPPPEGGPAARWGRARSIAVPFNPGARRERLHPGQQGLARARASQLPATYRLFVSASVG